MGMGDAKELGDGIDIHLRACPDVILHRQAWAKEVLFPRCRVDEECKVGHLDASEVEHVAILAKGIGIGWIIDWCVAVAEDQDESLADLLGELVAALPIALDHFVTPVHGCHNCGISFQRYSKIAQ